MSQDDFENRENTAMASDFVEQVHAVAAEWVRCGWMIKWIDQHGREIWELTPTGRHALRLPPQALQ
jgi:hypothetical protein